MKSLLLSLWMYLGGPLFWGAWMVWRLRILTLNEFLACLWPWGGLMLLVFLAIHLRNLYWGRFSLLVHCLLVVTLGVLGTFGFLTLPRFLGFPGPWAGATDWWLKSLTGSLAGASLVGMFYPVFSVGIVSSRSGWADFSRVLHRFNLGTVAFGLAAYGAGIVLAKGFVPFDPLVILSMAGPLAMSVFMLWKSRCSAV